MILQVVRPQTGTAQASSNVAASPTAPQQDTAVLLAAQPAQITALPVPPGPSESQLSPAPIAQALAVQPFENAACRRPPSDDQKEEWAAIIAGMEAQCEPWPAHWSEPGPEDGQHASHPAGASNAQAQLAAPGPQDASRALSAAHEETPAGGYAAAGPTGLSQPAPSAIQSAGLELATEAIHSMQAAAAADSAKLPPNQKLKPARGPSGCSAAGPAASTSCSQVPSTASGAAQDILHTESLVWPAVLASLKGSPLASAASPNKAGRQAPRRLQTAGQQQHETCKKPIPHATSTFFHIEMIGWCLPEL